MADYNAVERMATRAEKGVRDLSDYEYDTHEAIHAGQHWVAGEADSVVEIDAVDVGASADETTVTLKFHDREAVDENGDSVDYVYTTTAASLFTRMEADGGWHYVPLTVKSGPGRCPNCSKFLPTHGGEHEFPWAGCDECQITLGYEELEEQGVVHPVLL